MKIGIFTDSLDRVTGGIKRRVNMANELIRRDYDVSLLLKNKKESKRWKGLPILAKREISSFEMEKDFFFIGDHRFQLPVWRTVKGQKIWMFQGLAKSFRSRLLDMFQSSEIIALTFSSWMKEKVEKTFNRKAILAPGAVDTKFYSPSKEGRNPILLSAFNHLGDLGRENKEKLIKEIKKLLTAKRWTFALLKGNEFEIREMYRRAGLFISLKEDLEGDFWRDWNNPVAEAMATKTPTILLKAGGSRDIAFHKETAYVLENNLPKTILEGIEWMIENQKERNRIAKNGHVKIQNFSYKKMIDIIEEEILKK